jgi:hypothetical protein
MSQKPKIPLAPRIADAERDLPLLNTFIRETASAIGSLAEDAGQQRRATKSAVPQRPDAKSPNTVPLIEFYLAGHEYSPGNWAQEMYWDDQRRTMLIDNFVFAPPSVRVATGRGVLTERERRRELARANWGGVQFWIKTPTQVVPATGIATLEQFHDSPDGLWYRETIQIGLESVPATPETWTFIAASADLDGVIVKDASGVPLGPRVNLQTLPRADTVLGLSASIQQYFAESGDQVFRFVVSWSNPPVPRYKAVRIVVSGFRSGGDIILGETKEGDTSFTSAEYPIPDQQITVTIYAVSIFGDGTTLPLASSPSIQVTIGRTTGPTGREYAEFVTLGAKAVEVLGYTTNADGQRVLNLRFNWTNPPDIRYGGVVILADWFDGQRYEVAVNGAGATTVTWATTRFPPTSSQNVTFWFVSMDRNMRRNTLVTTGGVNATPNRTVSLPAPGTANITGVSFFDVQASRRDRADGTRILVLDVSFVPPSDPRWGSVNIKTSEDGGITWRTRVSTNRSPVSFEISDPRFVVALTVGAFSVDVNGRENTTPDATTTVFYGGQFLLDLTMVNLNTTAEYAGQAQFGRDLFNKFKINWVHGDLVVQGTIASKHLVTSGIDVGNSTSGAQMPARINVYNPSGQIIGFIGTDASGNQGGWFKTLRVGGTSYSSAPFQVDLNGNLKIDFTNTASGDNRQVIVSQSDTDAPFKVRNTGSGRAVAIDASLGTGLGTVGVRAGDITSQSGMSTINLHAPVPYVGNFAKTGVFAYGHSTSRFAHFWATSDPFNSGNVGSQSGIVVAHTNVTRRFEVLIDDWTTQNSWYTNYLRLTNLDIQLSDGTTTWTGVTQDVSFLKPDNSTGTLQFRKGILVNVI